MNIVPKTKSQIDSRILAELKKFETDTTRQYLTNVDLNQRITKILGQFIKPHEPVRTSFEYQLFLSIHRNTPLYKNLK